MRKSAITFALILGSFGLLSSALACPEGMVQVRSGAVITKIKGKSFFKFLTPVILESFESEIQIGTSYKLSLAVNLRTDLGTVLGAADRLYPIRIAEATGTDNPISKHLRLGSIEKVSLNGQPDASRDIDRELFTLTRNERIEFEGFTVGQFLAEINQEGDVLTICRENAPMVNL